MVDRITHHPGTTGLKLSLLAGLLSSLLTVVLLTTSVAQAAQPSGCSWQIISSPNIGSGTTELIGVSVLSLSNVWAVGAFTQGPNFRTLVEHWDGKTWSVVPSPNVGSGTNTLSGVTAISPNNVWAVGAYTKNSGLTYQTLTEHWNGSSWSVVPSPNVGPDTNGLFTVSPVPNSPTGELWAVGFYSTTLVTLHTKTLIEHWDGKTWSVVKSPSPGAGNNSLSQVIAFSSSEAWAVGSADERVNSNLVSQTLIERWNGFFWSVVSSPNVGTNNDFLSGATAFSPNDIWAVGSTNSNSGDQTLTEHWDGSSWSIVPSPNVPGANFSILGAAAVIRGSNAGQVWAVGYSFNINSPTQTLIEHWDGKSWSIAPSPNVPNASNFLAGVATAPNAGSGPVWAVGFAIPNSGNAQTLTESHC